MKNLNYKISEEKNIFDDHFLDIIGSQFKFSHEKGIAEWLKNSVDAYIRANIADNKQYILLRFNDSEKNDPIFECIDFVGMTFVDIEKALKIWGDPEAARKGSTNKVYGGHGNGGKFYMRQMFSESCFITYKNGLLNVFGFNKKKQYGFVNEFKNKKVDYVEALKIANLQEVYIPKEYLDKIKENKIGFTVVRGASPSGMKNKIKIKKICEKLIKHPQSMRIIERANIKIIYNSQLFPDKLKAEELKSLEGFEEPKVYEVPEKLNYAVDNEIETIYLSNKKYPSGRLILKTSEIALSSSGKYSDLNRIDIIGELGVIATYQIRELGLYYPQADFIYGECECPILEDSENDCVSNDRTKLVAENPKSKVLLEWITDMIKNLCEEILKKEQKERKDINKKISSDYNNFLNQWKNRFLSKILDEILVGPGGGPGTVMGIENSFRDKKDEKSVDNMEKEKRNKLKEGSGGITKKVNKHLIVLLSGHDEDPLNPHNKLFLQQGHGLIYQRPQDVRKGIYWINTSSHLAEIILDRYGANSPRWRGYLFQRYIDIFIKEALIKLEKRDPERFNASTIDGEILGKLVSMVHKQAAKDLNSFLFDDSYEI